MAHKKRAPLLTALATATGEAERQRDRETEAERQRGREAERQRGRETETSGMSHQAKYSFVSFTLCGKNRKGRAVTVLDEWS